MSVGTAGAGERMAMRIRVMRIIARMNVGGPALQITGLMREMDLTRFDQRLYAGVVGKGEEDFLRLRASDVEHVPIDGLGRSITPAGDLRALLALRQEIRSFRPHIVHTHTAKAGVLGRVAALTSGVDPALVHTFHGHLLHGYFSRPVTAAVRTVERGLAKKTDLLFSVGTQVRDDLLAVDVGRPEQYVVMPPGIPVPPPSHRGTARHSLGLPTDGLVVTFVGRLTQVKNPLRFLAVVQELVDRHPGLQAIMVGGGPLEQQVAAAAEPLADRVHLLGWRSDVETIYAASDLVILTSDNEGMPVALIEAAMCGVPAVTTDVGSAREVVEHGLTGLVSRTAVRALADAADALLSDPNLRARAGARARWRANELFSTRRLVTETQAAYEQLLAASTRWSAPK